MTSASCAVASAVPARACSSRSSSRSPYAISTPPDDGGGFVSTTVRRNRTVSGRRRTTRYARRSAEVTVPPVSRRWPTILPASSPSYRSRAPCSAIRSNVSPRSGSRSLSPAVRRLYTRRPSAVWRRITSRIACRYACCRDSSKPDRASWTAGETSSRHGSEPYDRNAASSPAAVPGTAHEAGPM